ncbi:transcription initiation factor IID, 18kD subunit-domain-containing protein [Xylaria digitata]|nr:transcription initiation factor IID, 18kD subunit-domain-containing protein [Xylaria digitata]
MEPRARAGKHVGKETFNPKESKFSAFSSRILRFDHELLFLTPLSRRLVSALLYAYGDVRDPIPETVRVLDEIVTEFLEGVCFEASRHAQVAGRQKLKFDDFEFALRRNPQYLGKVKAMIEKRQTIKEMRKTFNQDDDALAKDMAARDKDAANTKQEDDDLVGLDDDLDLKELGAETSSRGSGAKKRKLGAK